MAKQTLDYEAIVNDATEKLQVRFAEIQHELAPLREEEREVAEAIKRISGSYPPGYSNGSTSRPASARSASSGSRERLSPEERAGQVMEYVSANPDGVTAVQVAEALGVSTATATKAINALLEAGTLRSEGQRKSRRLFAG